MARIRVLIADDHALMLNGIKSLLEDHFEVAGTASDGRELVDSALALKPDLVVLDVSMPQLNGVEAAKQIHAALPAAKLVFLSMHTTPIYVRKALEAGGSAYVLKAGATEELLEAIRQVLAGNIYLSPALSRDVLPHLLNSAGGPSRENTELTDRQREILQLVAEGRMSKEIAHLLKISVKTVDFHRARIMSKLGAHSVAELVRLAVEEDLIPPSTAHAL